eukprot:Phypoly_transcript_02510.p1 GENE.Phypoly_transcript_02510~~Phypoly_transcript_02510.p1  ORF type:complete len:869 (+),score=145.88 Phypoly_transcript_02510:128-2734(+)
MEELGAPNPKRIKQDEEVSSNAILVSFIDGFMSLCQHSHYNWQTYLEVIPKIAFLGTLPLNLFLERHVIKHLVTFALVESKKRDKQIIRATDVLLLEKAIKILSILVQKCRTKTNPITGNSPRAGTRDLLAMPKDDLEILYCTDLYKNAIKKRIVQHSLVNIILHLSWENADFSNAITLVFCRDIKNYSHRFCVWYSTLAPFLSLHDSYHPFRVDQTMESFLAELHLIQAARITLNAIRFWQQTALGDLKNTQANSHGNATVCAWFIAHMEWVREWLIASTSEDVRKECYSFILALIQSEGDFTKRAETKYAFVAYLLGSLEFARDCCAPGGFKSWRIAHYARLLRELITEPRERNLFAHRHMAFVLLLDRCNFNNAPYDQNKRELCALWEQVLAHAPDLVRWIVQNERAQNLLVRFRVDVNSSCAQYNAEALPPYFRILDMCCEHPKFLVLLRAKPPKAVLNVLLYTRGEFPDIESVFEIVRKCAFDPTYREARIVEVMWVEAHLVNFGSLPRLLQILVQTRKEVVQFYKKGGLEFLSKVEITQISSLSVNQHSHLKSLVEVFLDLLEHEPHDEPLSSYIFSEYIDFQISLAYCLLKFTTHYPPPSYLLPPAMHPSASPLPSTPSFPSAFFAPPTDPTGHSFASSFPSSPSFSSSSPSPLLFPANKSTDALPKVSPSLPPLMPSSLPPSSSTFVSSPSPSASPARLCVSVAVKTAIAAFSRFKNDRVGLPSPPPGSCHEVLSFLLVLWNHEQCGPILKTDPSFSRLVSTILSDGFVFLCNRPHLEIILRFYKHISATLTSLDKSRLLSGLTEQLSQVTKSSAEGENSQATKTFRMVLDVDPELQTQYSLENLPVFADIEKYFSGGLE